MFQRYKKRQSIRRVVSYIFVVSSLIYLAWRLTIINYDAPVISFIFLLAEVIGFIIALGAIFLSSNYTQRQSQPAPKGLAVDVFVTIYQEPIDVVRRTVTAASQIQYPHRTVILDDGKREEVRLLAENLGCTYLSREQNLNAKAGNLNFGFSNSSAEFVAVFDADHIPQPDALDNLLGYFNDEKIALAQAPQDFYNLDSIQFVNSKDGGIWHDQSFFYNLAQPNADTFGGPICVGTGVIYRRSAIDAIGGIPTDTITEDLHTSLILHKAGFETAYHPESVAYGIGEIGLKDYYNVRLRWGHGNIHALRLENIISCSGLTFKQRLNYLLVGLNYLEGWQYLIFYLIPVYSLLTGVPPFVITPLNIGLMVLFPIFTYLLVQEFTCGFGRFWVNELYAMMRFPIAVMSSMAVFRDKLTWRSSSKAADGKIDFRLMMPQLTIVAISLGALIYSISFNWGELSPGVLSKIIAQPSLIFTINPNQEYEDGFSLDLLLVAGFWALLNVGRGLLFAWKIIGSARGASQNYFFKIPLLMELKQKNDQSKMITTSAISLSEFKLDKVDLNIEGKDELSGVLYLPGHSIPISIRAFSGVGKGKWRYNFDVLNPEDLEVLESSLYSVKWHRNLFHSKSEFLTPLQVLGRFFGISKHKANNKCRSQPKLISNGREKSEVVYGNQIRDKAINSK